MTVVIVYKGTLKKYEYKGVSSIISNKDTLGLGCAKPIGVLQIQKKEIKKVVIKNV